MTLSNEEDIRDFSPDRPLANQMVDQIMGALAQNEEAAYMVYLKLAPKFGLGNE